MDGHIGGVSIGLYFEDVGAGIAGLGGVRSYFCQDLLPFLGSFLYLLQTLVDVFLAHFAEIYGEPFFPDNLHLIRHIHRKIINLLLIGRKHQMLNRINIHKLPTNLINLIESEFDVNFGIAQGLDNNV